MPYIGYQLKKPNIPAQIAYEDEANTYTEIQTMENTDEFPIRVRYTGSTLPYTWGIDFKQKNSSSVYKGFANIDAVSLSNTAGAEEGQFFIDITRGGGRQTSLYLDDTGLGFGENNLYGILSDAGLTNFNHYTFPDATCKLASLPAGSYSYTIYIESGTIKARNNNNGKVEYSGDATNDCAPTIKNAINNLKNVGTNQDTQFTGGVFLQRGYYKCKTEITVDIDGVTRHGVAIEGEGMGTFLDFVPTGALANGIKLRMSYPRVRNMRIRGNSNVASFIKVEKNDTDEDAVNSGSLENILFESTNGNAELTIGGPPYTTPVSNQTGVNFNAGNTNPVYFWNLNNLKFVNLDIGIHTGGGEDSTSVMASNIVSQECRITWLLTDNSGSHNLQNCWFEGPLFARYGVYISAGTGGFHMANVFSEYEVPGVECALLKTESGVEGSNIEVINSQNIEQDYVNHFTVIDNTGGWIKWSDNYVAQRGAAKMFNWNGTQTTHTQPTVIQFNTNSPFKIYKSSNATLDELTLPFQLRDSANNQTSYAQFNTTITTNTNGNETAEFWIDLMRAGSLDTVFYLDGNGLAFGADGPGFGTLADTGLTTFREYTFEDANGKVVGNSSVDVTFADGKDFAFGSSSGTKFGTATSQKIAFFNKTPVAQQTGGVATAGGTYTSTEQNMLQKVYDMARTFGFLS